MITGWPTTFNNMILNSKLRSISKNITDCFDDLEITSAVSGNLFLLEKHIEEIRTLFYNVWLDREVEDFVKTHIIWKKYNLHVFWENDYHLMATNPLLVEKCGKFCMNDKYSHHMWNSIWKSSSTVFVNVFGRPWCHVKWSLSWLWKESTWLLWT